LVTPITKFLADIILRRRKLDVDELARNFPRIAASGDEFFVI